MPATFAPARFADLLTAGTLATLTDPSAAASTADLDTAHADVQRLAEQVAGQDATEDTVDTLKQLADAVERLDSERHTRTRLDTVTAGILNRIRPATAASADTPLSPTERAAAMAARRPAANAPRRSTGGQAGRLRATITASGREISDADQLVEAMTEAMNTAAARGGKDLHNLVASARWDYPQSRQLSADPEQNWRTIDAATSPTALVASGGVCAPTSVDFTVPVFSALDRPVQASLPAFQAPHGGVRFLTPPTLATVANAVGVWTAANDANPTSPATKAKYTVVCGSETEVKLDAITTRLVIGNFAGRFAPEWVAAHTQLAAAVHARTAEQNLLNKIFAASTETTVAKLIGATPDLLADVSLAAAALRYRLRQRSDAMVRIIAPAFVKDMLRSDLARRIPGDSALAVTDAQLDGYFAARSVVVTWALDGIAAQGSGNTYAQQGFAAAQATGALHDYPASVVFSAFPEGSFQFLDGGQLDLGVVRDSTLNATNDFETFSESFENVAFRGIEALKVIAAVRPNGEVAGAADTSAY